MRPPAEPVSNSACNSNAVTVGATVDRQSVASLAVEFWSRNLELRGLAQLARSRPVGVPNANSPCHPLSKVLWKRWVHPSCRQWWIGCLLSRLKTSCRMTSWPGQSSIPCCCRRERTSTCAASTMGVGRRLRVMATKGRLGSLCLPSQLDHLPG